MERPAGGLAGPAAAQTLPRLQTDWKIRRHFKGTVTGGDGGGSAEVASPDGQPQTGGRTRAGFSLSSSRQDRRRLPDQAKGVTIFVNLPPQGRGVPSSLPEGEGDPK